MGIRWGMWIRMGGILSSAVRLPEEQLLGFLVLLSVD
jgi:hypothetical protein